MMDRRSALKRLGGAVAGALAVGGGLAATGAAAPGQGSSAAHGHGAHSDPGAGAPGRVIAGNHMGTRYEIVDRGRTAELKLNGRGVGHHAFSKVRDRYASHLLPFGDPDDPRGNYRDAEKLARLLIEENGVSFVL